MHNFAVGEYISTCRFCLEFSQIIGPGRCNQAPQVQENWFVCILKQIVSFSHCYQITDCDLPAPRNGWWGFEIRPQLSQWTFRASIFVFLAERDNLSVPRGPRQNGWDHLTPDHPSGIWGMALSLHGAHHTGEVSSLNCVYLLAPCRENLPINCMLILSLNDPMVFFALFFYKPALQSLDKSVNFTTPLLVHPSFASDIFPSALHFWLLRCYHALRPPSPKYIHINT